MKDYFVYILTNQRNTVLYTGVTNNIRRRVVEHQMGIGSKFTKKYNVNKLIYFEIYNNIREAIIREKQIKNYSRKRKEQLINSFNSDWNDLASEV